MAVTRGQEELPSEPPWLSVCRSVLLGSQMPPNGQTQRFKTPPGYSRVPQAPIWAVRLTVLHTSRLPWSSILIIAHLQAMNRPQARSPNILDALKLVCSPVDFYPWINLAGPGCVPASKLRMHWLEALVMWTNHVLDPRDALEIVVSILPAQSHWHTWQRGL